MDIEIIPRKLKGRLQALPSKSHAHRLLIALKLAQLQGGEAADSEIPEHTGVCADGHTAASDADIIPTFSKDIEATKDCLAQLDASRPLLDCIESGSTLRFLLPITMALRDEAVFTGEGKLPSRPISPLKEEMERHGCSFILGGEHPQNPEPAPGSPAAAACAGEFNKSSGCGSGSHREICSVRGRLQSGSYRLAGNISSQFITGLLFALPLLDGDSTLELTTKLESAGYVDLTLDVLRTFGIRISEGRTPGGFIIYEIKGRQQYTRPHSLSVQSDWSNAAFWLACGALGGDVTLDGMDMSSSQRDREFTDILMQMGALLEFSDIDSDTPDDSVNCISGNHPEADAGGRTADDSKNCASGSRPDLGMQSASGTQLCSVRCTGSGLKAARINASQIPDLVPVLAAVMALAQGHSEITHAERLRIKESDRLFTVHDFLSKLGADITEESDGLSINGKHTLSGGEVYGHNDHRIVMAAAVASCCCENPVIIRGAEAVNKSYPDFFRDFAALGGEVRRIEL